MCKLRYTAPVGVCWCHCALESDSYHRMLLSIYLFWSIFTPHIHLIKTPAARCLKLLLAGGHPGQLVYLVCGYIKLVKF